MEPYQADHVVVSADVEEIEIAFSIADEDFRALRRAIACLTGEENTSFGEGNATDRQPA